MHTKTLRISNFILFFIGILILFIERKYAFEAGLLLMLTACVNLLLINNRDNFELRRFF